MAATNDMGLTCGNAMIYGVVMARVCEGYVVTTPREARGLDNNSIYRYETTRTKERNATEKGYM